ncbi:MAG TPA: glycosyltransferase family 4 protein, partial [Bryobacteraceae bacterium]|nr:glycosyltransferase family 4 protein [Bryobacteraceae bacterium]
DAQNGQRSRQTRPTVLFVGLDWIRKGGPDLVEAVGRARVEFPNLRLRVVGCAPEHLPDYCDVIGAVSLEEVRRHMEEADLFCLPTKVEPFGIVVLEALAAGAPVVVPNSGAFPDFVRHGWNGFLHEPCDVTSLTEALLEALRLGDGLEKVRARTRQSVLPHYTWANVAERVLPLFTDGARAPERRPARAIA